ncbi:CPBP family intramembrane glutamic endopeptidase [Reichenbachiella versicolor]|uniref:CPBP family intramembrane glutamic endopeptidase n=1 Tax=Reichenbachiella versicolor TaxID=1821036 RepID=UPI000D6DCC7E|nr:CPBP family intramembrane glutamic endopeptidase [Reichenbachiella versicolor]
MTNKLDSPKVWFILLAIVIQFILMQGSQILLIEIIQLINPNIDRMNPTVFIPIRVFGHIVGMLVILLVAYLISLKRRISLGKQFGLQFPPLLKWQVFILGISSLAIASLAGRIAQAMFGLPEIEQKTLSFLEQLSPLTMVVHVLITALFAGFFEEITFRGFIQRHLSKRVGVIWAILISGLMFGLVHIAPYGIVLSTLMGIWFGIVVWRVGSIWPTIWGHIFINGFNSFYMSGKYVLGFPETPSLILQWTLGVISFSALLYSIWLLWRTSLPLSENTK